MLTALLQPMDEFSCVSMKSGATTPALGWCSSRPYLVADSVESYRIDQIDEENIAAIFDRRSLTEGLAFRHSIPPDLMTLLRDWALGFCPLNSIERSSAI